MVIVKWLSANVACDGFQKAQTEFIVDFIFWCILFVVFYWGNSYTVKAPFSCFAYFPRNSYTLMLFRFLEIAPQILVAALFFPNSLEDQHDNVISTQ